MQPEIYWNAIAAKVGDHRQWNQLERQLQDMVIQKVMEAIGIVDMVFVNTLGTLMNTRLVKS